MLRLAASPKACPAQKHEDLSSSFQQANKLGGISESTARASWVLFGCNLLALGATQTMLGSRRRARGCWEAGDVLQHVSPDSFLCPQPWRGRLINAAGSPCKHPEMLAAPTRAGSSPNPSGTLQEKGRATRTRRNPAARGSSSTSSAPALLIPPGFISEVR